MEPVAGTGVETIRLAAFTRVSDGRVIVLNRAGMQQLFSFFVQKTADA
jgi:hypothetical protein